MRFLLLTCLLALGTFSLSAQNHLFKVLANKGENVVRSASGTEKALKTGATLEKGDILKVGDGAYVGLVHNSGKTMEIKKAGDFPVDDLAASASGSSSSLASKYADFVLSKMDEDGAGRGSLAVTGAVERATSESSIKVMLPSSSEVLNPEAIVRWRGSEDKNATYVVTLKNIFDDVIMTEETDKTKIKIDFSNEKLAKERLVIFSVKQKGNDDFKSNDYGIKRLGGDDAKEINNNLSKLRAEVKDESALDKLILASFYEENNLLVDALTKYEQAVTLSPEVEDFQKLYETFLVKNGLGK